MCKRPFYDLLPTIECDTPRTVQCRLAVNPGMQICGCNKADSHKIEKVLNFRSVYLRLSYTVQYLMVHFNLVDRSKRLQSFV